MKQKVLHMLDENYDFSDKKGKLSFSVDFIEMAFDVDEIREGSFVVTNCSPTPMKGFVMSDCPRMKCREVSFEGDEAEIFYSFDSTGMEPSDVVKGDFQIISDKGEYLLSFQAKMEPGYLYSSLGHIKNLFHFTNLAKTNWKEAVSLYYSDRFTELLAGSDVAYRTLYRGLSALPYNEQCMDEFLVAIKKKERVVYSVEQTKIILGEVKEELYREIELHKNGWGFVSGTLETETPFIVLEKHSFTEDDFIGNTAKLPFYVDVEELHYGRNYGEILLRAGNKLFRIEVVADYCYLPAEKNDGYAWKQQTAKLLHMYLDFRLGHKDRSEWIRESEPVVARIKGDNDLVTVARLYQVQLLLAEDKVQDAAWLMSRIEEEMVKEKQYPEVYGYFLYLTTLLNKEEDYINKVSQKVKKLYVKERSNPGLAWLTLYLREDFFYHPDKKWEFLQECLYQGINSPLLYAEALHLLKEMPALLSKLEEYEFLLLNFARKHNALTPAIAERMQFLVGRKKNYEQRWYDILAACYELEPSKELLQTICSYLMKGSCVGPEYFKWYEKAVYAELKLTRLYEYFVQSIALDEMRELPLLVMMYFAYQNNLDYERMAYLHVNVMKHKEKYPEIAASYAERLPEFVKAQIEQGHINGHLITLYKKVIDVQELDVKLANDYARLLFMNEIAVPEDVTSVVVVHENFLGEESAKAHNGKVYLPIYGVKYHLICIDKNQRRYVAQQLCPKPVLFEEALYEKMLPLVSNDGVFQLHHCEASRTYVAVSQENAFGYARMLQSEETTFTYKKEILVALVKYYFQNDYIRELDELLMQVQADKITGEERGELIHILVARGMYAEAFEWLCVYGPEHVDTKDILRLCSRLLERNGYEQDDDMTRLCAYLYRNNRYDPNILNYLILHFNGSLRETRALFRACDSFGLEGYNLLERILVQTLFTGTFLNEKYQLYELYRKAGGSLEIEKAFLVRCAYDYLVKETLMDEGVLKRICELVEEGEPVNRVLRLAYLKVVSGEDDSKWNIDVIQKLVLDEIKKDRVFPFFLNFAGKIPLLLPFTDYAYVEYRGESDSRVTMHYAIEHDNGVETEYRKEEMHNLYGGIFVKSFLLFFGESIQYYITESSGNREQLTQSSQVERAEELNYNTDWKYSVLNEAAIGREVRDYQTCEKMLYEYMKQENLIRKIFSENN